VVGNALDYFAFIIAAILALLFASEEPPASPDREAK